MSTTTTNLELVKPAGNERVDVDVINGNYDKIDEFAGLAITDANYVHTDNNYTTTEKDKLSAIQPNATATSFTQTLVSGTAVGTITINGTSYTIYAPTASGGASALNDLTDVTLASPSNGQVLKYNATTGKWENANESGGGGGYIPTGESYTFTIDGSVASSNLAMFVTWTDGESTQVAWVCTYSQISTGWTTGDYKNVTINWDSSNQTFNFVAKSGSFECNGSYFDEGETMGTLASGNITFLAVEKTEEGVDWTQVQLSGTKIAEIEIDGVSQNVYAPTPPTKTSDLTNDSNFVADASYVHTDNNYTTTEKNKLSGLVEVEANPSGTASTDLTKIAIDGTNYNIPSGGSGSSTFAGLSDVDIDDTTLANGQVPVWNSTTEKWENGAGGSGTTVVPNPQGTPTGELLAIQIGNDIYSLPEGESEHLLNDILTGPDATKATASSTSQDGAIWKAFDGVKTGTEQSCWIPEYGSTNCWICYHFANPKYITKCHVYFYENMNGTYTGAVKIQGSNDGTNWTDISQPLSLSMNRGIHDYEIESTDIVNGYSYVRMFSETALVVYGNASACTLELEIYGRDNASGGGGHTIIDSDGNEMTARSGLQFENAYVSDDSTNDKTVVPIYREMTRQEYSQAQDKTGLIVVTDDKAKVVNADSVYPVETSISEHAYSVGDHLIVDGVTYIVIDDIAIGDSLVEDTNIEAETIDDRLVSAIADNLTTDDSTKALSAKQGKVLNEKIDGMLKRKYFDMTSTGQNALYIVTNNEKRIPVGLTITEYDTGYNRAFLSSVGGNIVLNTYKLDGTAYSGNLKGYYYYINDDWT